jgi:hypothetical protein
MRYLIKLKIIAMESEIVFRLYRFCYDACEKLSNKHSEIVKKGCKLMTEHSRGGEQWNS